VHLFYPLEGGESSLESGSCAHNKKTMSVAGPCTGQEQGTTEDKQGIRCSTGHTHPQTLSLRPVGKPMGKPLATKRMTKHVQAVSTGKEIQTAANAFSPVVGGCG